MNNIQNIKYPLIFLIKLCLLIDKFPDILNDEIVSKIMKTFFMYHSDVAMKVNTKLIFTYCKNINKYENSIKATDDYYLLISNKLKILYAIKKWENIYYYKYFWKLPLNEQIDHLNNIKIMLLSIFDCSVNTFNIYYIKINEILNDPKCNREIIIENIKERVKALLKLFGIKVFKTLEIPFYHSDDFNYLQNDLIILYLKNIFHKLLLLINQTICVFDIYKKNYNDINSYLNIEN